MSKTPFTCLLLLSIAFCALVQGTNCPLSLAKCFFALGGGQRESGGTLSQPQVLSKECATLYLQYFESGQYTADTEAAISDAQPLLNRTVGDYDLVMFDIDETCLSNFALLDGADIRSGLQELRSTLAAATRPAINATLSLYISLRKAGYSVGFITGRPEAFRNTTLANLEAVGYGVQCTSESTPEDICFDALVLKPDDDNRDLTVYKQEARGDLVSDGYTIVASVGDQWSDLLGLNSPLFLIKMPNPLYYSP